MSTYHPDRWCVIKVHAPVEKIYRVFATWGGGYAGSDSWKLNSGIVGARLVDGRWEFDGYSGSVYSCHPDGYGVSGYGSPILQTLIDHAANQDIKVEVLPHDTDWSQIQYEPLAQWIQEGQQ